MQMQAQKGKIADFNSFKLREMVPILEKEVEAGNYVFLADLTG